MTTPGPHDIPRSPSGFATGRAAEALQRIEETGSVVANALPVRLYHPAEGADENVIAHFQYTPEEPWSVFGDVTRGPRGLVISRLEITPEESSSGVTAGLLRKVPIGEILAAVRAKAAWESARQEGTRALLAEEPAAGLFSEGDAQAPRKGGRAPITQDLLREVAHVYLKETAPGSPAGAMKRMAERFGRPEETIRTWVTRARKDGWLGPSAKGRAGAEPGYKLIRWLGETMMSSESLFKEASQIGRPLGITTSGPIKAAVRAWGDIAERDLMQRMGLAPFEGCVAAEAVFGQPVSAELAERKGRAGASEESALDEIAAELRQTLDQAPWDMG